MKNARLTGAISKDNALPPTTVTPRHLKKVTHWIRTRPRSIGVGFKCACLPIAIHTDLAGLNLSDNSTLKPTHKSSIHCRPEIDGHSNSISSAYKIQNTPHKKIRHTAANIITTQLHDKYINKQIEQRRRQDNALSDTIINYKIVAEELEM
jgi:hypothetical protein